MTIAARSPNSQTIYTREAEARKEYRLCFIEGILQMVAVNREQLVCYGGYKGPFIHPIATGEQRHRVKDRQPIYSFKINALSFGVNNLSE